MPEGYSLGDAVQAILDTEKRSPCQRILQRSFRAVRSPSVALGSTVWLIVAAVVACISCSACCMSFIHPSRFSQRCLRRASAALLASSLVAARYYRHYRHYFC
ncbi:hypothetical protein KCP71_16135 [Salmonella enterica subsp. enterica]|nr:hypothetical protein KCP71_16135 [Salmonella enterica subsp. enterica]